MGEEYLELLKKAQNDIKMADHLISVTYKVVNDPKMLLSVLTRLEEVLSNIIQALIVHERLYKRIPPVNEGFESKYMVFKELTRKYHFSIEYIKVIEEVRDILKKHSDSPVEFSRQKKFVICNDDYNMQVVSVDKIKNYINKTKLFHMDVKRLVTKHGRSAI